MNYKMLAVGNSTFVFAGKVTVITRFESSKIRKEVASLRTSEDSSRLIDATKHKAVKAVVILDNGAHVLSNLAPETLVKRLADLMGGEDE